MKAAELYDRDFFEWTVRNAELLRSGRTTEADLEHIAEEIEDMGKRERRELVSRLSVLMAHLLKWQVQTDRRSNSWTTTIRMQRTDIKELITQMPSLRPFLVGNLDKAYQHGVMMAVVETGLPVEAFASTCGWELDALLDEEFMP